MIESPGLFEVDAATYHADPCPEPSLSNSLIGSLLDCPRLAWWQHPRMNPQWVPEPAAARMDLGSVAHKLLLGAGAELAVIEADDYRTKDAKAARDAARAGGRIPVLVDQLETATHMVAAAHHQLGAFDFPNPFKGDGKSELGLFWQEDDVWCRNLIDRFLDERWEVWDYKTTGININPDAAGLGMHAVDMGYDTQCAMQERGLEALFPTMAGRLKFRLLFQQTEPPYLISVIEPDPATMTIARKKVDYAINRWRECVIANAWPGYPAKIMPMRHAEFLASRWLSREIEESDAGTFPHAKPIALRRNPGRPPKEMLTNLAGG